MTSVFTRIIAGQLPGRFVHEDDQVVAFLSIAPVRPGHTLVVPRQEVDDWTTVDPALLQHCTAVAQRIGGAVRSAWDAPRAILMIAGFEVQHLHLHVYPAWTLADANATDLDREPRPEDLDDAADRIRRALASSR